MKFAALAIGVAAMALSVDAFGCKPDEVKGWITACDSVSGVTKNKCDDRKCHTALHRLVEEETIQCYEESGLGKGTDLVIYQEIDAFCHGEGPDPGPKTLPPFTVAPPPSTAPVVTDTPAPTSTNPGPSPTPTKPDVTPTVTPGPAC